MIRNDQIEPARADILAFVAWVLELLERLREGDHIETDDGPLLDRNAMMVFRDAWPDFQADFGGSGWQARVSAAEPAALQAHGLYGPQLATKLWMVSYLFQRFLATLPENGRQRLGAAPSWRLAAQAPEVQARPHDRPKGLLKRLIEVIDIPLDSIIAALGLNGSVTEAKKLLGVSIDD